jgi:hypothetical protein
MFRTMAVLILSLTTLTAQGALLGRAALTAGGTDYRAYYDDVLNITWLANPKAGAGSAFDDGPSPTDGTMSWSSTQAWLASLNSAAHLGASNWRLPDVDVNGDALIVQCGGPAACPDNEMGHHSQSNDVQLNAICQLSSVCDPGPFGSIGGSYYWSSSPAPGGNSAWVFYFPMNETWTLDKATGSGAVWAVRTGDLALVPAPGAIWLLGTALVVMRWMGRKIGT